MPNFLNTKVGLEALGGCIFKRKKGEKLFWKSALVQRDFTCFSFLSRQDLFSEIDISKIALALLTSALHRWSQVAHSYFKF